MPFLTFSIISYPVMMLIYTAQSTFGFGVKGDALQQHKVAWLAFQFGTTWISLLGTLAVVVMIDGCIKYVNRRFFTQFEHLVHEAEAHGTCFVAGKKLGGPGATKPTIADGDTVPSQKDLALAHLDAIDEELWGLEKAGLLEIPGPKLPSFPETEERSGGRQQAQKSVINIANPLDVSRNGRERTQSEVELASGKRGDKPVSRPSVVSLNASAGGMSMDHHAAETVATTLRRHISESEGFGTRKARTSM
jgi:hypothetical protein